MSTSPDERQPTGEADPQTAPTLAFEAAEETPLAPRETREFSVVVHPPAAYTVRLALLDARDAALDTSSVVTDTEGRGRAKLTAPSSPGVFGIRARVEGASSDWMLSVVSGLLTRLEVVPVYRGRRNVTEWVGSVHTGHSCRDFGLIAEDSRVYARFAYDETAQFSKVPLAPELAVTVRAGQFAGGCTEVGPSLGSGDLRVEVQVRDRGLDLSSTSLGITLGLGPGDPAFHGAVEAGLRVLVAAFRGEATTDLTALLDGMDGKIRGTLRQRFRAARAEGSWDVSFTNSNDASASRLSGGIERWVRLGEATLVSSRAFEGILVPSESNPDHAPSLVVERMGQLEAPSLDLNAESTGWSVDPFESLAFKGTVTWDHARLVSELARAPALAETGAPTVAGALAVVAGCEQLAAQLVSGDQPAASALNATCDPSCLTKVCEDALVSQWDRAISEASLGTATLSLTAAGNTTIGERAQAIAIDGRWVGALTVSDSTTETSGTLRGSAPRFSQR